VRAWVSSENYVRPDLLLVATLFWNGTQFLLSTCRDFCWPINRILINHPMLCYFELYINLLHDFKPDCSADVELMALSLKVLLPKKPGDFQTPTERNWNSPPLFVLVLPLLSRVRKRWKSQKHIQTPNLPTIKSHLWSFSLAAVSSDIHFQEDQQHQEHRWIRIPTTWIIQCSIAQTPCLHRASFFLYLGERI